MTVPLLEDSQADSGAFPHSPLHERIEKLEAIISFLSVELSALKENILELERTNLDLTDNNKALCQLISLGLSGPRNISSPKAPPNTPRNILEERKSVGAVSTCDESNGSEVGCGRILLTEVESLPTEFQSISPTDTAACKREGARCPRLEDTYTH